MSQLFLRKPTPFVAFDKVELPGFFNEVIAVLWSHPFTNSNIDFNHNDLHMI